MDNKQPRIQRLLREISGVSAILSLIILVTVFLLTRDILHYWLTVTFRIFLSLFLLITSIVCLIPEYIILTPVKPELPVLGPVARLVAQCLLTADEAELSNRKLASEVLKTQAQIIALQNQINPHFLYNTLESIRSKALLHDDEEIATMTEILARLFRYNIGRAEDSASIADELENVQDYISIQNYRFRNKFILKIDVQEIKDVLESYQIPPLTLQPIIENAVHYGLERKTGQGTITIDCFKTQSKLILRVADDGVGMSTEEVDQIREKLRSATGIPVRVQRAKQGSGIALVNVHQRIRLSFGEQYGLELISTPNIGTQIDVVLPDAELLIKDKNEN